MKLVERGTVFRRPIAVPESLDELHGPSSGKLEIPITVIWSSQSLREMDTENDDDLVSVYRETLSVASREDLVRIINKNSLIRLWPRLLGDREVRSAWESRFPELNVY